MADLFRWVPGPDGDDLRCKMGRKATKYTQKSICFGKLGRKRLKNFWRPGPVGFRIEEAIEREAGRARRGQDWAKIGPKTFFVGPKTGQNIGHHPGYPVHFEICRPRRGAGRG